MREYIGFPCINWLASDQGCKKQNTYNMSYIYVMELLHIYILTLSLTPLLCYHESSTKSFCQYHVNIVYDPTPLFFQNFTSKFSWAKTFVDRVQKYFGSGNCCGKSTKNLASLLWSFFPCHLSDLLFRYNVTFCSIKK